MRAYSSVRNSNSPNLDKENIITHVVRISCLSSCLSHWRWSPLVGVEFGREVQGQFFRTNIYSCCPRSSQMEKRDQAKKDLQGLEETVVCTEQKTALTSRIICLTTTTTAAITTTTTHWQRLQLECVLMLPRVINIKLRLQSHQKYYVTQYEGLGFS